MKSINDEIYICLLREERGLSNQEILKRFFRMENAGDSIAERIVEPLLLRDVRFHKNDQNTWHAVKITSPDTLPLASASFILFAIDEIVEGGAAGRDVFAVLEQYSSFILYRGGMAEEVHRNRIREILEEVNKYIFLPYDVNSLHRLKRIYRMLSPLELDMLTLSIKNMVSHFYPEKKYRKWEDIIRDFSIVNFESGAPYSKVRTLLHVFEHILNQAYERGLKEVGDLIEISNKARKWIDFSHYAFDKGFLKNIPETPGVYLFCNREGQVVYVGKTNNLRARINSYFRDTGESVEKKELILRHLYAIKYKTLGSDLEALIEEYKLIDLYKPLFNTKKKIPERVIEVSDQILLFPSVSGKRLKLYFLSNKIPLIECGFAPEKDSSVVRKILERLEEGEGYVFDPLKIIALSYLKRYEELIVVVDIERYRNSEDVLKALKSQYENLRAYCDNSKKAGFEKITYI